MAAISYLLYAGGVLENVVAGTNQPGLTQAVVTAGAAAIVATNDFQANQPVQFSGAVGTITGIVAATTYFVSATGLSSAGFQIALTAGGSPIVPGGTATATLLFFVLGAVEIRIDQTATALTDAQSTTGTRALKKGEAQQLIRILEEYLIRDTNVIE